MATYKWDKAAQTWVKFSDRSFRKESGDGKSFKQQVLDGYRRIEERGQKHYGTPSGIQKIWA